MKVPYSYLPRQFDNPDPILDKIRDLVKRDGTYVAVPVTLGGYSDNYSEVLSADIEEGELICQLILIIRSPVLISSCTLHSYPPNTMISK